MNATEINQRVQELNLLLGYIYKRLVEIKDQRGIKSLTSQLQNVTTR